MNDETQTFVEELKKYISTYATLRKSCLPKRVCDMGDAREMGSYDGLTDALDYIDEFITLWENEKR